MAFFINKLITYTFYMGYFVTNWGFYFDDKNVFWLIESYFQGGNPLGRLLRAHSDWMSNSFGFVFIFRAREWSHGNCGSRRNTERECLEGVIRAGFWCFGFAICPFKYWLIYFYFGLCLVFAAVAGLSPVAACGLLAERAPLVVEHQLADRQASVVAAGGPTSCSPWALECRLDSCGTWVHMPHRCGVFPDQGSNWCSLHCKVDS